MNHACNTSMESSRCSEERETEEDVVRVIGSEESCGEDGQGWRRFEGVQLLLSMGLPYARSLYVPNAFPFAWLPARHMDGHLGESSSSNLFPQDFP